jgi:hypothetical protein
VAFTLVDTDILIDSGRGDQEAIDCLQRLEQLSSLATSVVTQMELIVGCRNKTELRALEMFLQRFQILKITEQSSDRVKRTLLLLGLFIPVVFSGCEIDTRVMVSRENPPKFTFSGSGSIAQFFISGPYISEEIKILSQSKNLMTKEELKKLREAVPGDRLLWQLAPQNINSTLPNIPPVTYGILTSEFKQIFPKDNQAPSPLLEGKYYRVSAPSYSANYVITTFMISGNKAITIR